MQSKAVSVNDYLQGMDEERRRVVAAVREVILANLDPGYSEAMQYGMIGYSVPHSLYPAGYHVDPTQALPFAALASQKNHVSLYLMGLAIGGRPGAESEDVAWFKREWGATGRKQLDMGKACIRFKKVEDVPLELIGEAIKRMPVARLLALYEHSHADAKGTKT